MSTETHKIKVGRYVAQLQVEVGPAGVGRVELHWIGEQPGRLSPADWTRLKQAKSKIVARLAGIIGTKAEG